MELIIKNRLHPCQRTVYDDDTRFRVLAAGRRWGKTRLAVITVFEVGLQGGWAWWVAPTYRVADNGWDPIRKLSLKVPNAEIRYADKVVNYPGGGRVDIRTADDPSKLVGSGLDFVALDEFGSMKKRVWTESIRPSLSDRLGRALFIGTPKGRNEFYQLYLRGQAGEEGWKSWRYPTSNNPFISKAEIEAAKRDLPELTFRQEYEAEFIDDEGSVFRRVKEAAVNEIQMPQPDRQYMAGVDVAASVDYTVVSVMDIESHSQVYVDRFNRVDYPVLIDRLQSIYQRYHMTSMVIEANSIGRPVIDELVHRGLNIVPFFTTNATKQTIIQNLQAAFENGDISIISEESTIDGMPIGAIQVGELLSYESKRSISGSFSYSAPENQHDDTVMALAIAWNGMTAGNVVYAPYLFG
jgi:phage terminase large subunit-like protein